ncbi:MAG: divergent polysaccharide deacetylase family protein, partial [Gammaproteobacteria bacterium]|nr:divergent polysaccharide deacetylase family protein [Gammaproteobacteria bacterium]
MKIVNSLIASLLAIIVGQLPAYAGSKAEIALIIDDLGNNPDTGLAALQLPGNIAYSFLPNTPHATILAELAHEKGKQVMVHIPMESEHHERLGPNALLADMEEQEYKSVLQAALEAVPYAVGLNNHMGSLLTQKEMPMQWLMDVLGQNNLFFLDSRTTTKTVAQKTAGIMGITTLRRDVFLDNSRDEAAIRIQFAELISKAKRRGYATGIAHPYPETITVLKQMLP